MDTRSLSVAVSVGVGVAAFVYYYERLLPKRTRASSIEAPPCESMKRPTEAPSSAAPEAKARLGRHLRLFRGKLERADGTKVDAAEALQGKVVALYFSAHWSAAPTRHPLSHALTAHTAPFSPYTIQQPMHPIYTKHYHASL